MYIVVVFFSVLANRHTRKHTYEIDRYSYVLAKVHRLGKVGFGPNLGVRRYIE